MGVFYELSLQKYSSNVIEKCFEKCDEFILAKFVEEICQQSKILDLMKNSYGNYVVQKALKLSSGSSKNTIIAYIKKNLEKLTDKKLITKWKTIVNSSLHLNFGNLDQGQGLNIFPENSTMSNNSTNNNFNNFSPLYSPINCEYNPDSRFARSLADSPIHMIHNQMMQNNYNNNQMRGNNSQMMPNFCKPYFYPNHPNNQYY